MSINWKHIGLCVAAGALVAVVAYFILAPDNVDYVNVALVPELAEAIGADLPTRLQLAYIGKNLLDTLKGPPGTALQSGDFADSWGESSLESAGERVFKLLSVEQRKIFYSKFRAREVLAVNYHTAPAASGSKRATFTVTFGWKNSPQSTQRSLRETADQLDRVWETIPSEQVAKSLVDHAEHAVDSAARKWLRKYSEENNRGRLSARSTETREEKRARFQERAAEMRRNHEERAAEMREDHRRRAAEMRADHDRRVREMREKREKTNR